MLLKHHPLCFPLRLYHRQFLVHEASQTEARWASDGHALVDEAELVAAGLTNVRELLPALAEHDSEADFEFGLELLISALDALPRTAVHAAGWRG